MAYQTILPTALARRGLTVETVPGWETRGSSSFSPGGAVCHWTAGPAKSKTRPSLNVVVNGRPDLPGPLCNVYLDRNGVAVVVAAGRANHAGTGGWRGLTGNSSVFGTEAEAAGPDDWTEAQRLAYPKVCAAFANIGGFSADMVCGHSEWAGPRKTDINGYPMNGLRAETAAILNGNTAEDYMTSDEAAAVLARIEAKLDRMPIDVFNDLNANPLILERNGGQPRDARSVDGDIYVHTVAIINMMQQLLRREAADVDEAALAQALAPVVIEALGKSHGLTADDVEAAVRKVLGAVVVPAVVTDPR